MNRKRVIKNYKKKKRNAQGQEGNKKGGLISFLFEKTRAHVWVGLSSVATFTTATPADQRLFFGTRTNTNRVCDSNQIEREQKSRK